MANKIINLSNDDLQVYNNMLLKFVDIALSNRIVPASAFQNISGNSDELTELLPMTTNLDAYELNKSLEILNKAIPIMENFNTELSMKLDGNRKLISDYLKANDLQIIALAESDEDDVEDVTDYGQIARMVAKQLLEDNDDDITLAMKLRGYASDFIKDIASKAVHKNDGLPEHRQKTSKVFDHIANYMKDSHEGKISDEDEYSRNLDDLMSGVCSKINSERQEQQKLKSKYPKWYERED